MNAAVVGGGAVGTVLAQYLSHAGLRVNLIGRDGAIVDWFPVVESGDSELLYSGCRPADLQRAQIVFFATKAFDVKRAADRWLPNMPELISAVFLCNGYLEAEVEQLSAQYDHVEFRRGVVTFGAKKHRHRYLISNTAGRVQFGSMSGKDATSFERQLVSATSKLSWVDTIEAVVKRKWIFNTVINTLCAKYSLNENGLLKNFTSEVDLWFEEAFSLADRLYLNVKLDSGDTKDEMWRLIEATSNNCNSMVVDIQTGRKTEHRYLAGLACNFDGYPALKSWVPVEQG